MKCPHSFPYPEGVDHHGFMDQATPLLAAGSAFLTNSIERATRIPDARASIRVAVYALSG